MKYLLNIFCCLIVWNSYGQDFKMEYKFFLLRDFIQTNQIKSLKVTEANDSIEAQTKVKYHCFFDEKGRLTKVLDYYFTTDSIAEREIRYTYQNDAVYYHKKIYYYIDPLGFILYEKNWEIDFSQNEISEQFFDNKSQIFRENRLVFNSQKQLIERITKSGSITYDVDFTYDEEGRLNIVKLVMDNPTLKVNPLGNIKKTDFKYNLSGRLSASEQWDTENRLQINQYYYVYSGNSIIRKVGWNLVPKGNKTIKSIERTNIDYSKNGYPVSAHTFTDSKSGLPDVFTQFDYEFYDTSKAESTDKAQLSTKFVSVFLAKLFIIE